MLLLDKIERQGLSLGHVSMNRSRHSRVPHALSKKAATRHGVWVLLLID